MSHVSPFCRYISSFIGALLLFGVAGCSDKKPEVPKEQELPWKTADVGPEKICMDADRHLRSGIALEDDYFIGMICVTDSMAPEDVDEFLRKAQAYQDESGAFHFFLAGDLKKFPQLPEEMKDKVKSKDDKDIVGVHVSSEALAQTIGIDQRFAAGGKYRGFPLPFARRGHYDLTQNALTGVLSNDAVAIAADASQDPDLFYWLDMSAHAQTEMTSSIPDAQAAWKKFVTTHIAEAKTQCEKNNKTSVRYSLYHLGLAMHAVEDLAAHRGRTNPEHAHNSYTYFQGEHDPDKDAQAYELGEKIIKTFVQNALSGPLATCREPFKAFRGGGLSYNDKVKELGMKQDLTPNTLKDYIVSKDQFKGIRIRWFGEEYPTPTECSNECADLVSGLLK